MKNQYKILDLIREAIMVRFLSSSLSNSSSTTYAQCFCKPDDPRLTTFLEIDDLTQSKWQVHVISKDFNEEASPKFIP